MKNIFVVGILFCISFSSQAIYSIDVFHDSLYQYSLQDISQAHFTPLESTINNGRNNGVYWFKVIDYNASCQNMYIRIEHAHIQKTEFYDWNHTLIPEIKEERYAAYVIESTAKSDTFYLKVICEKEGFIPVHVYNEESYLNLIQKEYLQLGLFYGVIASILLIHLLFFYNSRHKSYLFYSCMLLSLAATFAYRDGLFYYMFGNHWITNHIEPLINISITFSLALFSSEYLQHKKFTPAFYRYGIITLILPFISYIVYLTQYNFDFFILTENLVILSLTVYYMTSIYLYKSNMYSKFFALAYGPILLFCYIYYNSGFFGIELLEFSLDNFKIGGITEMIIFTFAITYQAKMLQAENKELQQDIANKNKELATYTMQFVEKNTFIQHISENLEQLKPSSDHQDKVLGRLKKSIHSALDSENAWEEFKIRFEDVNEKFYSNLKRDYPNLSNAEIKLAALLKLRLSIKESAALLNHSERSVVSARSRLRKKFGLSQGDSLYDFLDKY